MIAAFLAPPATVVVLDAPLRMEGVHGVQLVIHEMNSSGIPVGRLQSSGPLSALRSAPLRTILPRTLTNVVQQIFVNAVSGLKEFNFID